MPTMNSGTWAVSASGSPRTKPAAWGVAGALGGGGRARAQLDIQDADHVAELPEPVGVTGCLPERRFRPHLPLDVGAGLGQQRFQDGLSRLLVQAVPGIGLGRSEG